MKLSLSFRNSAKAFVALAALGLVGACSDTSSTVAPAVAAPAFVAPANFVQIGLPTIFRVNNSEGIVKRIGDHVISIPAGAICDPLKSGYGSTMWDKGCSALRGTIAITATVMQDNDGMPYVDFQPALRFAPNKEVMVFLRQGKNVAGKQLGVKYCNNLGYCVDESLTDRSLKPFRVGKTSIIGRRVKHFSGYVIAYEGDCGSQVLPIGDGSYMCGNEGGGIGVGRRSGYMVASGEDVTEVMGGEMGKITKGPDGEDHE